MKNLSYSIIILSILLISSISLAHEGSVLEKVAEGYTFGVSLTPENPVVGGDTKISVMITDSTVQIS